MRTAEATPAGPDRRVTKGMAARSLRCHQAGTSGARLADAGTDDTMRAQPPDRRCRYALRRVPLGCIPAARRAARSRSVRLTDAGR
ncbi:hypothetical protein XarbCFBP8132_05335 [Xanthomonas arboricola]|nr:hypothetical protein XarbCFBP8132_05335 [Xanthomonas arboricola]